MKMQRYETQRNLMDTDTRYRIANWPGIAWSYSHDETEPDEDTHWSGYENSTGNVIMVMVGDDREFSFDPSDCEPLDDDEYCIVCGQIGCTHNA